MSAAAAARRAARAARRMANGLDNLDWSMPNGIGGSPLDNLEINPNRVDDLDVMPEDLAEPDLVDPRPVVPNDWERVIPDGVTLRPGEDPNLQGAATPIVVEPDVRPRPNDLPEPTAPSPATTGLDEIVRDAPDEVPTPSLSTAQKLGLGATLGGAGIATLYDIFGPTGGSPEGSPPGSPPAESPPGGGFRFDPPFPGPTGRNDPADPAGAGQAMGPGQRPPTGWEEPRIRRLANRAGIPYAQALAMVQAGYDEQNIGHVVDKQSANPDFYQRRQAYGTLRQLGHDQLDQARRARQAEVVARAQRQYNPMATLSPEWRDFVMAERLLRDSRNVGASPNDIRQAAEAAKAAMESRLGTGAGFQPRSPEEQRILQDRGDAEQRQTNPQAAGMRDIQEGKFETKEARDVLRNLAKPYDTVWFGGAPEEAFPDIKARLMGSPYNLPEAQADIAAREAMRQTNWW